MTKIIFLLAVILVITSCGTSPATVELSEGINYDVRFFYEGVDLAAPSVGLPGAMTNVQNQVVIIWEKNEEGAWVFYDFTMPLGSTLTELVWGKVYIVVTNSTCSWTLPISGE